MISMDGQNPIKVYNKSMFRREWVLLLGYVENSAICIGFLDSFTAVIEIGNFPHKQ
jgi:hypothetical protein